ncbi:MAG: alpha/beta hydrolase-fold protein, partial [Bacteroidota bacterium]
LDGHYRPFIDLVVKTIEYNTNNRKYIPTIVVGIHAKSRGMEFSMLNPNNEWEQDYEGGRAPELQRHLRGEVIPFIEKLYPEARDFKTLIGHSAGGNFVFYTVFGEQSDMFDAYISISPGMRPGEQVVVERAAANLEKGASFPRFLYGCAGTVGEREDLFSTGLMQVDSLLKAHPNHGLSWHPEILEGQDHFTIVPVAVNAGMLALTRTFRVDEKILQDLIAEDKSNVIKRVKEFYAEREKQYGFSDYLFPTSIKNFIQYLGRNKEYEVGLEIGYWGQAMYPDDFRLNNAIGYLHKDAGDLDATRRVFENSLKILERTKGDMAEERYQDRKELVEGWIKELD